MAAAESYPEDLKYHREHDWARIDGDEVDPPVIEQVSQPLVLRDDPRYPVRRRFDDREQAHWLVIMDRAVIDALQREPRLKVGVAAVHDAHAGNDVVRHFTAAAVDGGVHGGEVVFHTDPLRHDLSR